MPWPNAARGFGDEVGQKRSVNRGKGLPCRGAGLRPPAARLGDAGQTPHSAGAPPRAAPHRAAGWMDRRRRIWGRLPGGNAGQVAPGKKTWDPANRKERTPIGRGLFQGLWEWRISDYSLCRGPIHMKTMGRSRHFRCTPSAARELAAARTLARGSARGPHGFKGPTDRSVKRSGRWMRYGVRARPRSGGRGALVPGAGESDLRHVLVDYASRKETNAPPRARWAMEEREELQEGTLLREGDPEDGPLTRASRKAKTALKVGGWLGPEMFWRICRAFVSLGRLTRGDRWGRVAAAFSHGEMGRGDGRPSAKVGLAAAEDGQQENGTGEP